LLNGHPIFIQPEEARMKSIKVTPEQMSHRMARFKDLKSYQYANEAAAGIPMAVLEKIAAHRVYPLMVPETYTGRSAQAPIKSAPGVVLSIAECPPGDGPAMHIHEQTIENFFCLSGRFDIGWGDPGEEHSITLEPLDFISVPPGVPRRFTNVHASETGRLLVIIHVQTQEQSDRIAYQPELREEIESKHGSKTVEALDRIGINFTAGV
jgi:uncharacterized RmlC-like cupin family protein